MAAVLACIGAETWRVAGVTVACGAVFDFVAPDLIWGRVTDVARRGLVMLLLAWPITLYVTPAVARDFHDGRLITVRIAGNEFHVPANYFLDYVPDTVKPDGLLIYALLPHMDPMREDNKQEFMRGGWGRKVHILGTDVKRITSLDFRLHSEERMGAPYDRHKDKYGLEVYLPSGFGIINKGRWRKEIYVDNDTGKLTAYIICDVDGDVPLPGCSQEFLYRNLLLRVSYGKPLLSQWHAIEQSVKRLLDSFATQALLRNDGHSNS